MTAVYAVRKQRGKLHIARAIRGGYVAACYRTVTGRDLVVYEGRQADRAWKWEDRCLDCQTLAQRGPRALARISGLARH